MSYFIIDNETLETKRIFQSKYNRPVNFVIGSNKPHPVSVNDLNNESARSSGDEVASFYRSIISKPSTAGSSSKAAYNNASNSSPSTTINREFEQQERTLSNNESSLSEKAAVPSKTDLWFCEFCDTTLPSSDYKRHIQGTAHMVSSSKQYPSAPDMLTIDAENVGFKMLRSQGWKYEEGLGAQGQGRRHPIATVLKHDRLAVGHKETGKKLITHKHSEIERKAILRQCVRKERQKKPGKMIARTAKVESKQRVALLHYLKE
ncbi:hypothetical protein BDF20DRAFT_989283 [Mycotypha africana]|uniref:uncharacterized protein n=1 Tax=Mycotypha africana TaxID=64632 RepID=UPI0023009C0C|nr:uncharacterized protein BDF20DRAFT_989283 [Mycotypha africana]KAI8973280.1 hypothetical protein BDF20DRAFT_989283 [Mycotypha africana]